MKRSHHPEEFLQVHAHLRELHRLLLAALKKDRERVDGRVLTPVEWFQLLIGAPEYRWLKPLNSLLSDLDALKDLKQVSGPDLAIVRSELEFFFFRENDDVTSFNFHYRQLFAHNHDIVYTHGQVREAFAKLPQIAPPANPEAVRKGWHKIGASKRKLLN